MVSRRSREDLPLFMSLLEYLESQGSLDIEGEGLPDGKAMQQLMKSGLGLTRPELAILLAYTKMDAYQKLLDSDVPDEPLFLHYLHDYFPSYLQETYPERILRHSLRREILATQFTNTVINLLGITFVHRTIRDTGSTPVQVLKTALAALEIVKASDYIARLTSSRKVSAESFHSALGVLVGGLESLVNWALLTGADMEDLGGFIARYRDQMEHLLEILPEVLPEREVERLSEKVRCYEDMGFDAEFAQAIAALEYVPSGICVVDGARIGGLSLAEATQRYYMIGDRLRIGWLRERLRAVDSNDKWSSIANAGLIVDLRQIQLKLSLIERPLEELPGNPLGRYLQVLTEIENESHVGQSTGDVLARMLGQMADAGHREARQAVSKKSQSSSRDDQRALLAH